ncbi:MAG: hypothetical protein IKV64_01385 [Clostridia bacterium]|nr:hypothetical protein [Clostridia bacterium]
MNKASYTERKNFVKYDNEHYLLYLNEEATEIVVNEETGETVAGYNYYGNEVDGSVKIKASDVTEDNRRSKFIAGLIGTEFDVDAQIAILANDGDTTEHANDLARFKAFRSNCKIAIDELLSRTL